MPRFDKTGPDGEGAMTGRKKGLCTGNAADTNEMGLGRGRRRAGRGAGRMNFGFRFGGRGRSNTPLRGNTEKE